LDKSQKIILLSLLSISVTTWLFSIEQPDMMEAMMTLNPIAVTIFTISWTIGMAAMMFPAIIPMVLLYNRIISSDQNNNNKKDNLSLVSKFNQHTDNLEERENRQHSRSFALLSKRAIKTLGFVGTYLLVWALTGVMLLVFWSIIMNNLFIGYSVQDFAIVSGILRLCLEFCDCVWNLSI
jgi:hypothetical protein